MSNSATWISLLILGSIAASGQVTSGRLEGDVRDPQGAAIASAGIRVTNVGTGQAFETKTDSSGHWVIPAIPAAAFRVSISSPGFKTAGIENVKVDAGVPATVHATLEVGDLTESVEVRSGVEVVQSATAAVTSTLVGRQLHDLPFTSRNLTELLVTQTGTSTPGAPRTSSVNGLPQGALNITLDGINIQDNVNKSTDGFFNSIMPRADAVEEMVVTTAGATVDSNSEGAAQIKFVTRGGSNAFHGTVFWQHRNTALNANNYFNNQQGLPRDWILLNQAGAWVSGPIIRNRLFFMAHYEAFRLPQSYVSPAGQTLLTPEAMAGQFRYRDSSGAVKSVNLYELASRGGFVSSADPMIQRTLSQMARLSAAEGSLQSRIPTNADYNRSNYSFQSKGANNRNFPTLKLDYDLSQRHHLDFVTNYQTNIREPDGVSLGAASPILPGTGVVLGGTSRGNQRSIGFSGVTSLRSVLASRLTSEIRFGLTGGNVIFNDGVSPADFAQFDGYAPVFNFVTSPYRSTGQSRRGTPLKQGNANATYAQSTHLVNLGGSFTQVDAWSGNNNGTQIVPTVSLASTGANDPVNFGATSIFTAANFPGATAQNLADAASLYALLTGRVAAIGRSAVLGDETNTYGQNATVFRSRQRQYGLYIQDRWRVRPGLTFNYGIRYDRQTPPRSLISAYTRPGIAGIWGISGVGNLFMPGTLTGTTPTYTPVPEGAPAYRGQGFFAPSLGLAWVLPKSWLTGSGQSVLRAGYSISSIREDAFRMDAVWGANQGRTINTSIDPGNFAAQFGPAGSVLLRNGALPSRTYSATPTYPIPVLAGNAVRDFDPELKVGYAQSWSAGMQRELNRGTVLEVRYVGTHGTRLWRQINLNEINIFESGFLQDFQIAHRNLQIARAAQPAGAAVSNNFGNQGLPGQQNLAILNVALGGVTTDQVTANQLVQGQAGAAAAGIVTNATRMGNLTRAGFPANLFLVNPATGGAAASLHVNGGNSQYHSMQVDVRRRLAAGFLAQGSYEWSHATSNAFSNGVAPTFSTLRNFDLDKGPSPFDIRHAVKLNWIYELPIGPGRRFLSGVHNGVIRKAVEGWQIASVTRIQAGSPNQLLSGRSTVNQNESGAVLHNLTQSQLQDMMEIRKTSSVVGGKAQGIVYYLPRDLIDNSLAAFELGGKTLRDLDPSKPYIGPPTTAGQFGYRLFLYGPWQRKWDFSIVKNTRIGERVNVELRAQALNAFNLANFMLGSPANSVNTLPMSSGFGQTGNNYRDLSNTNDPGARVIEFALRIHF